MHTPSAPRLKVRSHIPRPPASTITALQVRVWSTSRTPDQTYECALHAFRVGTLNTPSTFMVESLSNIMVKTQPLIQALVRIVLDVDSSILSNLFMYLGA